MFYSVGNAFAFTLGIADYDSPGRGPKLALSSDATTTKKIAREHAWRSPIAQTDLPKKGPSLVSREFDDPGKPDWAPDGVPKDSRITTFVNMQGVEFAEPGGYLWTHGLSTCIAVVIYGNPSVPPTGTRDRAYGGKILSHVNPFGMNSLLPSIVDLYRSNQALFQNPVVHIIAPNPNSFNAVMRPGIDQMRNQVWDYFSSQQDSHNRPVFSVQLTYHDVNEEDGNGEMIVWGNNQITMDGNLDCI